MSTDDIETFIPVAHGPSAKALITKSAVVAEHLVEPQLEKLAAVRALFGAAYPVARLAARARGLVDDDAAQRDPAAAAPLLDRPALDVVLLVRDRDRGEVGREDRAGRTSPPPCSFEEGAVRGHVLARLLEGEPSAPAPGAPEHRLEPRPQQMLAARDPQCEPAHRPGRAEEAEDERAPNRIRHTITSAAGRRALRGGSAQNPSRSSNQISPASSSVPEPLDQPCMRDRIRDHGAERVQVEAVRRQGEPEPHQHPPGVELLSGRRPGPGDPADGRGAARPAEVEAAQERAHRRRLAQAVVAEEQPDERPSEAQAGRREAVAGTLRYAVGEVRPLADLRTAVVLAEVLEERVGVQPDDPVDELRVGGEPRLVPERAGDLGELGERRVGRRLAVVAAARRAPPVQQLDRRSRLLAARLQAHPGSQGRLGRVHPELRIERLVPKRQSARGCGDVERLEEDADARREEPALGVLDGEQPLHGHLEIGFVVRARPHAPGLRVVRGRREARILHELGPDRGHKALCAGGATRAGRRRRCCRRRRTW